VIQNKAARILVAEDEALIRLDLVEMLNEAGYEVVIYDSLIRSEINVISNLEKISKTKIVFVEGDILDTNLSLSVLYLLVAFLTSSGSIIPSFLNKL
jgi:UDP-glucose 4-epimerase